MPDVVALIVDEEELHPVNDRSADVFEGLDDLFNVLCRVLLQFDYQLVVSYAFLAEIRLL